MSSRPEARGLLTKRTGNPLAVLADSSFLEELKGRYYKLLGGAEGLNFTSLVLWHAPITKAGGDDDALTLNGLAAGYCLDYSSASRTLDMMRVAGCLRGTGCSFLEALGRESNVGQFLSGDINFNRLIRARKMYNQFRRHFADRLNTSLVCLLPHHGSRRSWDRKILLDMESVRFWVASAARRKDHYPPHWEVVADVTSAVDCQ